MLSVSHADFEILVGEGLDTLPDDKLRELDNVVFLVEDRPEDGSDVLGVYEGFSLAERESYGFGEEPDRIILSRESARPLRRYARAGVRDQNHARARDRTLLRDHRRAHSRAGVGLMAAHTEASSSSSSQLLAERPWQTVV